MKAAAVALSIFLITILQMNCNTLRSFGNGGEVKKILAKAVIEGYVYNTIKGTLEFSEEKDNGLLISGEIEGLLPDSTYAIHIIDAENCDTAVPAKDFDPGKSNKHGSPWLSPGQHHAGDLPNIKAGGNGKLKVKILTNNLDVSKTSMFSILNHCIVLFSHADDYEAQPIGNVGQRIACVKILIAE
jgi:superoxide dismutase, Cu-Zn family